MKITMALPNAVEGSYESKKDTVIITPFFYKGTARAPVLRITVENDKGVNQNFLLLISGQTGAINVQTLDKTIQAPFDALTTEEFTRKRDESNSRNKSKGQEDAAGPSGRRQPAPAAP